MDRDSSNTCCYLHFSPPLSVSPAFYHPIYSPPIPAFTSLRISPDPLPTLSWPLALSAPLLTLSRSSPVLPAPALALSAPLLALSTPSPAPFPLSPHLPRPSPIFTAPLPTPPYLVAPHRSSLTYLSVREW